MQIVKMANLVLRFGLELCLLAALGWWGFSVGGPLIVKILLAVLIVAGVAVVWGLFLSPRRTVPMGADARLVMEVVLFTLAVLALASLRQAVLGAALGVAYGVNRVLIMAWKQG